MSKKQKLFNISKGTVFPQEIVRIERKRKHINPTKWQTKGHTVHLIEIDLLDCFDLISPLCAIATS